MIKNFYNVLVLLTITIVVNSTMGILLPIYFNLENTTIFQITITLFISMSTAFFYLRYLNKKLSFLYTTVSKITEEKPDTTLPKQNLKYYFKNISYFFNNLEAILESYNRLITDQNILLKEHSLVNDELKNNNLARELMLEVSNSILEIKNTEELFKLILEKLISVIGDADKGSFIILNENNLLEYKSAIGYDISKLKNIKFKLEETFLWKKNYGNITKPCIIKDIRSFDSSNINNATYKALDTINALDVNTSLSTPIIIDNKLYGMINIDSFNINAFNEEDLLVAEYFSNQVSIAIKNHQLIEKIMYLSKYDRMTNIYNRCYFEEILSEFYKKASRYNENFSVVMFDLNSLKHINDTLGHAIGDILISNFAGTIKDNIRESDLFARYGGDEFIAIFFNSNTIDIENRLTSIIKYFNDNPLDIGDDKITISFSYGIASFPEESKDLNHLLKLADERMYSHKRISKSK